MKVISLATLLILVLCAVREGDCCSTSGDCQANECCVSRFQPVGKRQAAGAGTCHPLGVSGDGCLVRQGTYDATTHASHMYLRCPCGPNLACKGLGVFEVPLGEAGTCV